MKEKVLTCPFTGVEFKALELADGSLMVKNTITGEDIRIGYNPSSNFYIVKRHWFEHIDCIDISEAMELLGVSRQRVFELHKNQTVKSFTVNGKVYFKRADIVEYAQNRKVGAPRRKKD